MPAVPLRARGSSLLRRGRKSQLGRFAADAWHVLLWQGATTLGFLAQIALITHILGLTEYGRFTLVVAFVTLVGEFFDVRVGSAATVIGARKLDAGDLPGAGGVFQLTYLVDFTTGVVGFLVVIGLAPLVGPGLIGDHGSFLIVLFALTLLAGTVDGSSLAILRLLDRFRAITLYTAALEALRLGLVIAALVVYETLEAVIVAMVIAKVVTAVVTLLVTRSAFRRVAGDVPMVRIGRPAVEAGDRRDLFHMLVHTNVLSYGKLAQVQLPPLILGAMAGPAQAALYKLGLAASGILGKFVDPASVAITPRLARLWAAGQVGQARRLVKQASLVALPAMLLALVVLLPFGGTVLELLGGKAARDGESVFIITIIGQALYGLVFWHSNVLIAAGRARVLSRVTVVAAAVQLAVVLALVPSLDATGAAVGYLAGNVVINGVLAYLAVRSLQGPRADPGPRAQAVTPNSG